MFVSYMMADDELFLRLSLWLRCSAFGGYIAGLTATIVVMNVFNVRLLHQHLHLWMCHCSAAHVLSVRASKTALGLHYRAAMECTINTCA